MEIEGIPGKMQIIITYPALKQWVIDMFQEGRRSEAITAYSEGMIPMHHLLLLFPYEYENLPTLNEKEMGFIRDNKITAMKHYRDRVYCTVKDASRKINEVVQRKD